MNDAYAHVNKRLHSGHLYRRIRYTEMYDGSAYGGIFLCVLAMIEVGVITLYNNRAWGFAVHDAALGSLVLALPMFAIGTLLFFSGQARASWMKWLWWIDLVLVATVMAYFLWCVGADGVDAMVGFLRGETL